VPDWVEERLVIVLTVEIDQERPERAERADRARFSIEPSDRSTFGHHFSLDKEEVLGEVYAKFRALFAEGRLAREIEDDLDARLGGTGSDEFGVGSFAHGEFDGVNKQRFARASLTGQRGEARSHLELGAFDDGQILDG
jgi:hypothetical protein